MSSSSSAVDQAGTSQGPGLSRRLRESTARAHAEAESRGFVTSLMAGELDAAAYHLLARQHHAIYSALEQGARRLPAGDPAQALVFPELERVPVLEADLGAMVGPGWAELTLVPATRRYVDRLAQVAHTGPGYLAHAYTRYLGDLSGGQVIRTMLMRHYAIPAEQLGFYAFPVKAKPFKEAYRVRLDSLALSPGDADLAVAEAQTAFELNAAVFEDLLELVGPQARARA